MDTLRPVLLLVQRARSGQVAQVAFGKCTVVLVALLLAYRLTAAHRATHQLGR